MHRLMYLPLALTPLAACAVDEPTPTGDPPTGNVQVSFCYDDEVCSPATPFGLQFVGVDPDADDGHPDWPGRVALGGTETITLRRYTDDLEEHSEPFALPFVADDSGHAGVEVVDVEDNRVHVRATADAWNMLRIVAPDGTLYDRWPLVGQAIDRVQVRPPADEWWGPGRNDDVVWLPGDHDLVVALWGATNDLGMSARLYDESLRLALPGAASTAWDTLHVTGATVGHQTLAITGGSGARTVDIETVAAPDEIVVTGGEELGYDIPNTLCFHALAQGRYVADVQWTFSATGAQVTTDDVMSTPRSGCAFYWPDARTGTITIHAQASGFAQDITLPITP
jgi:hypothetical protein